jgi:serine/threonine protein kinase
LPKLSWLAYAGNPFSASHEFDGFALTDSSPCIAWDQLALKQRLGEGASGIIHQAAWQAGLDDVAVKIFKGALTSDGLPRNEMNACIAAGQHPSLIPVLGRIDQHPEGAEGLVMALIDPAYANLAGPPSLESCTRDVYAPDLVLSMAMVLRMALGIASVAAQLHARGIMHGDLYGHNILHCDQGHPVLGDFGAASFYDPTEQPVAEALQRLEVRAFGCLLEELMARSEPALAHAGLQSLQVSCMSELPAERPLFEEVVARLVAFGPELVKEK